LREKVNKQTGLVLAVALSALAGFGATPGLWSYDLRGAQLLADTIDRPLIVKFSNSSGKCALCNQFDAQIDRSDSWRAYASEQQLAMAFIDYAHRNWDFDYYYSVLTNYSAVTSFPAFVIYASDGKTVLDAFSYNSDQSYTPEAFVERVNRVLEENDYLIGGYDLWDPVDNTPAGATILGFQLFNQRQYHDLNLTPSDTDDWYKLKCARNKSYKLHLPAADYAIDFKGATDSYIVAETNNYYSALTNSPAMITTSNQVAAQFSRLISVTTNKNLSVTNGLPKVIQADSTLTGPHSVTSRTTRILGPYKTEIPGAPPLIVTNGVPQDLIAPTLQIYDPQLLNPLDFTLGVATVTNTALLNQMEDGLIFVPPPEFAGAYCFIHVQQQNEGELPYFETVEYHDLTTNTVISLTTNISTEAVVTTTIQSNITLQVAFLGPFPVFNPDLLPPDFESAVAVLTNELIDVSTLVVSNSFEVRVAEQSVDEIIFEGSNYVSYTYSRTQYLLNYRLWQPGRISFERPEISVRESSSSARVKITRQGGATGAALFAYAFEDRSTPASPYTAENGVDFNGVDGSISWADGESGSKTIEIPLIQDVVPIWEGNETFAVVMAPQAGAELLQAPMAGPSRCVVTLTEVTGRKPGEVNFAGYAPDEVTAPLPFADPRRPAVALSEGESVTLWLSRVNGSDGEIAVRVATRAGSARESESFEPLAEVVTWLHGESQPQAVTINTSELDGFTPDKNFTAELSNGQDARIGSAGKVTVTLRDVSVAQSLGDVSAAAGAAGFAFRTSGAIWFWDAGAALRSAPIASGSTRITLSLEGPGVISFDGEIHDSEPGDTLTLDGGVAVAKSLGADGGSVSALVKPGRQTLNWTLRAGSPAAGRELYAVLAALKWQPVPEAFNPHPSPNGQSYAPELTWEMPQSYAVALDGTFAVDPGAGLALSARVAGVSPAGAVIEGVTDSSLSELWGIDEPVPGRSYRWSVSTLCQHADGTALRQGPAWSFKGISREDAEVTAPPPEGLGASGYYEAVQGVLADFGVIYDAEDGITCRVSSGALPSGLKMDSRTGRISGVPSRVETKTLLIQAVARVGIRSVPYATTAITLRVNPMSGFDGNYNGWVQTALPDLAEYQGTAGFSLSASGKFSAKIAVAGAALSFAQSGADGVDDPADPQEIYLDELTGPSVRARDGTRWYSTLRNIMITKGASLTAELTHYTLVSDASGFQQVEAQSYTVQCMREIWKSAESAALMSAFEGYYTVLLPVTAPRDELAPWGSGYLTLTLNAGGSVKVSGMLADGSKVSLSTTLHYFEELDPALTEFAGQEAFVYIYAAPAAYQGIGALSGFLRITAAEQPQRNLISPADTPLQWWNFDPLSVYGSANTRADTTTGFFNEIAAAGGFYDKRTNLESFYLHQTLTFEDATAFPGADRLPEDHEGREGITGYLLYADILPFGTPLVAGASKLSVAKKEVVYLGESGAAPVNNSASAYDDIDLDESVNLNKLDLRLTHATGVLKGSFELYYERENQNAVFVQRTKKMQCDGVMTRVHPAQEPESYHLGIQGGGFYLLEDRSSWLDESGRTRSYSFDWSYGFELFSSEE